jgi:uncharacterized membrane protein YdfJ with MMPL/SSD domain
MKHTLAYLAGIVLIAGAMALAQSTGSNTQDTQSGSAASTQQNTGHTDANGDLPAVKEGESQSGKSSTADSSEDRPGAMGAPETPNTGTAPKGETPATGAQTEQKGTSDDNNTRPGSAPPDNSTDSSTPSQKSTDTGTQSPK